MEKPKNYDCVERSLKSFRLEIGIPFELFKKQYKDKIENPFIGVYEKLIQTHSIFMYESLGIELNALIYFECANWSYPLPYFHDINPGDILYNSYTKKEYLCIIGCFWDAQIKGLFLVEDVLLYSEVYKSSSWEVIYKTNHKTRGPKAYVEKEIIDLDTFELQPFKYL